jgi:hypothetical protein
MTVESIYLPVSYSGNGVTVAFAFPFQFFAPTDLIVRLFDLAANVPVAPPMLNGGAAFDYGVTGTIDDDGTGEYLNGTVTFNTAPPANYRITILRSVAALQSVSLSDDSLFPAKSVEAELDRLQMQIQQGQASAVRAITAPASDGAVNLVLPPAAVRADTVLTFDSAGNVESPGIGTGPLEAAIAALLAGVMPEAPASGWAKTLAAAMALFAAPVLLADGFVLHVACRNVSGDGYGGAFAYNAGDLASVFDRSGLGFVDATGRRFKRINDGKIVNLRWFDAPDNDTGDCVPAWQSAYPAAIAMGAALVVPGGTYNFSGPVTISNSYARVFAAGTVTLHFSGSGQGVRIDGGATGNGIVNVTFGGLGQFDIRGNSAITDGLYMRAAHHCNIDAKARDISSAGLRTAFVIGGRFQFTCSVNEQNMTVIPAYGVYLGARGTGEKTNNLVFSDLRCDGVGEGLHLEQAEGNQFLGGSLSGNQKGLTDSGGGNCRRNTFVGMWFEANVRLDFEGYGQGNLFIDCRFGGLGNLGNGCIELATATACGFSGGFIRNVDRQGNSTSWYDGVGFDGTTVSGGLQGTGLFRAHGIYRTDVNEVWVAPYPDVLPGFTVAQVPIGAFGGIIFVTNATGGPVPAYFDGPTSVTGQWRRVTDATIIN